MFLTLLAPLVFGAALRVQSDVGCPAPGEVSADLLAIVDLSEISAAQVYATLSRDGVWLKLELSEASGTSLGVRRLEASEDCAVLARTAAVVLAAWLSEEHPEFLVRVPDSAGAPEAAGRGANSVGGQVADPAPTAAAANQPADPARTVRQVPVQSSRVSAKSSPDHQPRLAFDAALALDAQAGGSDHGTPLAPAAWLGVSFGPLRSGLGVRASAVLIGPRTEPLAGQQVRWTRWPLLVGPDLTFGRGAARFAVEGGGALGWLRLEGQNFAANNARAALTFGGYAAFRWQPRVVALQPFVSIAPVLWFGRDTAVAASPNQERGERNLPVVELLLAAGVQFPM